MDCVESEEALESGLYKLTMTRPMIRVNEAMYAKFFSESGEGPVSIDVALSSLYSSCMFSSSMPSG